MINKNKLSKKLIKILGNILMLITILFIIRLLFKMDINYKDIVKKENIKWLIFLIFAYSFYLTFTCLPWKILIEYISETKLNILKVYCVYSKSNLLKYIPGNIFQYIGRNVLAIEANIKHQDVALATIFDIGIPLISGLIFSFLCLRKYAAEQFFKYGINTLEKYQIFIYIFIFIAIILIFVFRKIIIDNIKQYKKLVTFKFLLKLVYCIILYNLFSLSYAIIYLILLKTVFNISITTNIILVLMGSTIFSWVMGFIVPGAPGGLGIREVIMFAVAGNILPQNIIVISMVVFRVITVISDIVVFLNSIILEKILKYKKNKI